MLVAFAESKKISLICSRARQMILCCIVTHFCTTNHVVTHFTEKVGDNDFFLDFIHIFYIIQPPDAEWQTVERAVFFIR